MCAGRTHGKASIFKKLQVPFLENLLNLSLFIKEQSKKLKFEIKVCKVFFLPKTGKAVNDLKKVKTFFVWSISLVFAFKQAKENIVFQVKSLKKLQKIVFVCSF